MVVFLVLDSLADGRALVVAGGAWRPACNPARGCTRGAVAWHGALRSSVGRRIQDVPVYGARLRPRGGPVAARDLSHWARYRPRTRAWFRGKLSRGGLSGPGTASLSGQRSSARYGAQARLPCRGERADNVRPYSHQLADRYRHRRRARPARG